MFFSNFFPNFGHYKWIKMGRSKRHDSLRCAKCYKKYSRANEGVKWRAVVTLKKVGEAILCECLRCGHQYKSTSKAAYRQFS